MYTATHYQEAGRAFQPKTRQDFACLIAYLYGHCSDIALNLAKSP